jgi:hypothetical protein
MAIWSSLGLHKGRPKPQQKPSPLKRGHPELQNMSFLNFSIFVGLFCTLESGSGSSCTKSMGSGSETLVITRQSQYETVHSPYVSVRGEKNLLISGRGNPDPKETVDTFISITLSSRKRVTVEICCVIMQEKDLPILPMTARASYGDTSLPEGFTLDFSLIGGHHIAFHVKRWKRHWISA